MDTYITPGDDMDRSLNETVTEEIRKYLSEYNNNPPSEISFMSPVPSTSGPGGYIVNLYVFYFFRLTGKLTSFLQFQQFRLRNRTVVYNSKYRLLTFSVTISHSPITLGNLSSIHSLDVHVAQLYNHPFGHTEYFKDNSQYLYMKDRVYPLL
jgi:hypothetical protein